MKFRNILIIVTILAFSLSYSACRKLVQLDGNHHQISEKRQLVPFTKVVNEGSFNVYIIEDSISEAIVEAESNLIPYIRTIVNGETLIIDTRDNISPNIPVNVYIRTPEINSIKLSGSGTMTTDSLVGDNVEIKISGSGNITANVDAGILNATISGSGDMWLNAVAETTYTKISGSGNINLIGESNNGDFNISGSGKIHAYEFTLQELDANISGSGNMYLYVMQYLQVKISGSGSVYYMGNPSLDVSITGSGSVNHQ
jgi:hypothetical protein